MDATLKRGIEAYKQYFTAALPFLTILLFLLEWMKDKNDSENGYTERQKIESDLKICFLLMTFFYTIALCASYLPQFQSKICVFVGSFLIWAGLFSCIVFCEIEEFFKCQFHGSHKFIPFFVVFWLPQAAISGYYYYSTGGLMSDNDRKIQWFLRFCIEMMLTTSFTMYWISSVYGFVLYGEDLEENEQEVVVESESDSSDEEETESSYYELKCGICLRDYSSNLKRRMPRMMKCGHTVCYGCAKRLENIEDAIWITCPFCQKETLDDSKDLPKNYIIIGLLEEMKLSERRKKEVSTQTNDSF
uniref:RING-type domain-containing protein n=1 Tax=Caenorhabditis tropicalis TaxID=1561998 RepID=A0A1I7THL7_9PELO